MNADSARSPSAPGLLATQDKIKLAAGQAQLLEVGAALAWGDAAFSVGFE